MKKITILTMLLAIAAASFSQQTTPKQDWKESDYYKKSKKQKTAAWIFLGGGVAMFTGGMIAHFNYINNQDDPFAGIDQVTTGEVVAYCGVLVACGSIPFFILSSKNKRKAQAASAFINMEHAPVLQGTVFTNQSYPALGIKIPL